MKRAYQEPPLEKLTIKGVMAEGRLTQDPGPYDKVVVSLDGLCAEFPNGTCVHVTLESDHVHEHAGPCTSKA